MSRDLLVRERSRSHSLTEYKALSTRKRHHDMVDNDSDGERMSQNSRDLRHGSRDSLRNVDRKSMLLTTSLWMERIGVATRFHRIQREAGRGRRRRPLGLE